MKKSRYDKLKEKAVMKLLDQAVMKYGMADVRHGAMKWGNAQRRKIVLVRQQKQLEADLSAVREELRV